MVDLTDIEQTILETFGARMRQTPQSQKWHGEGDVLTHTLMARDALQSMVEYKALDEEQRAVLYLAALFHDIGKTTTTVFRDGNWQAPHHVPTGSRMAREFLWKGLGWCGTKELMEMREAVCLLVRYHSFPPHAIDLPDGRLRLHRIAANSKLAPLFSIRMLCLLCRADMLGRECDDQQHMLDQIALCEELAREEGCLDGCYPFPSEYTQRAFLSGRDVWKGQQLFDDTWGEVVMLSGLPGTGKDTWIAHNMPETPVVSLDSIRQERKILPTDHQGLVANIAREQARKYLRLHQPFVWNVTNITPLAREKLIWIFETYHAKVRIVNLETDWSTLIERNHSRESVVPQAAIERMLAKLVLPEVYEAEKVEWNTI